MANSSDFEVTAPPTDCISCMEFSPGVYPEIFLIAGSWDNSVRCWEVDRASGKTAPKILQNMQGPILDVCWSDDGSKVYMASCDKTVKCWDLTSNKTVQIGNHDAAVKSCHFIKADNKTCVMTSSWDKTLKFWDSRAPNPLTTLNLLERSYCVDVDYPVAVVGTADKELTVFNLQGTPVAHKRYKPCLRAQNRCVAIFRDKRNPGPFNYGFAYGCVEGRVAIQYLNTNDPKDNFNFKCHRSELVNNSQDIYAVNDIKFHPIHGTIATAGSDGCYGFWDKDARTRLKNSGVMQQPVSCCAFNSDGQIFAYALSYDWSKGHQHHDTSKKNSIFLHPCFNELRPSAPKS